MSPLYVEATPLLSKRLTGLGRFAARLIEALARQRPLRLFTSFDRAELERRNLYSTLCAGEVIAVDAPLRAADGDVDGWTAALLQPAPGGSRSVVTRGWVARGNTEAGSASDSACLYTLFRPAVRRFARELSVLYDFTPLLLPWCHARETQQLFGDFFANSVRLSDKAIAISHSTGHDAAWLCALPAQDVIVVYPGPSLCDLTHASSAPVERSPDLILAVSTREPRKNAAFLLSWFLNSTALGENAELWWAGPEGWLWDLAEGGAARFPGRRPRFRFLGMVSDAELCALYRRAGLLIYPSLYEGFGFPVLDALWHGTPVLSAFHSALKEFAATGVRYFDPYDCESLDGAYAALRSRPPAAVDLDDLRQRYSWDAMAHAISGLCA